MVFYQVLEVLEWFYKLTEKILFQKGVWFFITLGDPPSPRFGKRPYFSRIFFLHPSLSSSSTSTTSSSSTSTISSSITSTISSSRTSTTISSWQNRTWRKSLLL